MVRKPIVLLVVTSLLGCLFSMSVLGYDDGSNDGEYYYGYGDSIMRANSCGSYSDCFVSNVDSDYDTNPAHDSEHNTDGSGDESWIGVDEFSTHYNSGNDYFIFMFGANDDQWIYNGSKDLGDHVSAMLNMYNWSLENGSIPMLCLTPMKNNPGSKPWNDRNFSFSRINATMNMCENFSIRYYPMYDAIDSVPWNGWMDSFDSQHYCVGSDNHPDAGGHDEMAYMLWYFIQGWDYNTTYYGVNNTLIVDADYNETIYINNSYYGWDTGSLTVTCLSNSTEIGFTTNIAPNGSEMIHFTIVKDSVYELKNSDIVITSINNQGNNTSLTDRHRTINWTKTDGATKYHLQVSNYSDFRDYFIDLDNITVNANHFCNNSFLNTSDSARPGASNFIVVDNNITFYLPYSYNITYLDRYHYYRVRAYA